LLNALKISPGFMNDVAKVHPPFVSDEREGFFERKPADTPMAEDPVPIRSLKGHPRGPGAKMLPDLPVDAFRGTSALESRDWNGEFRDQGARLNALQFEAEAGVKGVFGSPEQGPGTGCLIDALQGFAQKQAAETFSPFVFRCRHRSDQGDGDGALRAA
jgi:hypothetical protein